MENKTRTTTLRLERWMISSTSIAISNRVRDNVDPIRATGFEMVNLIGWGVLKLILYYYVNSWYFKSDHRYRHPRSSSMTLLSLWVHSISLNRNYHHSHQRSDLVKGRGLKPVIGTDISLIIRKLLKKNKQM